MPLPVPRALIVDDEPAIRKLLQRALQAEGFECHTAEDGLAATELTRSHAFDLVVTDLAMPGQHGHSLAVQLLEKPARPLVVVLTGIAEPRLAKDLFARGVDDVVLKPVDFRMFAAKLRSLADRKRVSATTPPPSSPPTAPPKLPIVEDLDERLADVSQILPVSSVAFQVYSRCRNEEVPIAEIAPLIERDGALVAEVLHHANLTYHGAARKKILDVEQAVLRLGRQRVGEIAIATHALGSLTPSVLDWTNVRLLRRRSLAASAALQSIVAQGNLQQLEGGLNAAAIMHSLDRVVLSTLYPRHYAAMVDECRRSGGSLVDVEHTVFGHCPSAILARLLASWHLPGEIVLPVGALRKPYPALTQLAEPVRSKSELLKLAVFVGELAVGQWESWDQLEIPSAEILRQFKLDEHALAETIRQTRLAVDTDPQAGTSSASPGEKASATRSQIREIPYARLNSAPCDLLEPLLISLGLQPVANLEPASAGEYTLLNGIGLAPHELAEQLSTFSPESVAIITNLDMNAVPAEYDRVLALPCSQGAFEAFALEHLRGGNVLVAAATAR